MDSIRYMFLVIYVVWVIDIHTDAIQGPLVATANDREFPYVASILLGNHSSEIEQNHVCTGVLITKIYILTAAHCLYQRSLSDIRIILGSADLRQGKEFSPNFMITYDEWAAENGIPKKFVINDIGLIKLSKIVDKAISRPAELSSTKNHKLNGKDAVITGWGVPNGKVNESSRYLQKASVKIGCEDDPCQISQERLSVPDKYLCSKAEPYVLVTCGDSGGPLLIKNAVVGVNKGTCSTTLSPELPEVFVNSHKVNVHLSIYFYREFITNVIKNY